MAIFYTDTGSFSEVDISGSASRILDVRGSGSAILTVSGSAGGLLEVGDIGPSGDVFTIASGSINILHIKNTPSVVISGSLAVSGPIIGTAAINVSAGTLSSNVSNLVFSNANGVSFGLNGNTITATAAGGTGGGAASTFNYYNPQDGYLQVAGQLGQGSLWMQPSKLPNVQFDRIVIPINYSNATNSSNSFTVSMWMGFYTRDVSTLQLQSSFSTSYNITNSGTVGSYSLYNGFRNLSMGVGGTQTFLEDQYYIGLLSRTTTGGGAGMTMSNMQASQINSVFFGNFGQSTNSSIQYTRGLGIYSATTNAMPTSIRFNQILGMSSNSSLQLRQPLFYMVNGTL